MGTSKLTCMITTITINFTNLLIIGAGNCHTKLELAQPFAILFLIDIIISLKKIKNNLFNEAAMSIENKKLEL